MASAHSDKRIKLFLERSIERLPFDITQKAEEIYLPDGDPAEKLKHKIKTITEIAGDKYDQYTESVAVPEGAQQEDVCAPGQESLANAGKETESVASNAAMTPASAMAARVTSPQGIYAKLWHAQSEIGLALDVLNIIISSYQGTAGSLGGIGGIGAAGNGTISTLPNAPPTALPPGSLKCEYVPRIHPTVPTAISNEKMALGGKKHQLRHAANILIQGAQKLKSVMADEGQFWAGALRLRKNNWCIVPAKTGHHAQRLASGSQLFVHYGFQDVGSLYGNRSYAELVRNETSPSSKAGKAKRIELHIPNKSNKVVVMSLVRQGTPHTQGPRLSKSRRDETLHSQLIKAQNTLFDGELFHELMIEARSMNNCVSIVDNEIILPINDELELKVAYRTPTQEEMAFFSQSTSPSSSQATAPPELEKSDLSVSLEGTADILRYAMQLMQHRRYRQNIKDRTDSFFKSSRPGGGRVAGSFGQIQQTLQHRPTATLCMTLQALQYYSFSRKIREAAGKVTKNLRLSWWEPISVHSVDVKSPSSMSDSLTARTTVASGTSLFSSRGASGYGMGAAVSINLGSKAPAVRFVVRSHPVPCVVLQLPDRPSAPIMHVTEFERVLEQELTARGIERICEVVNSIQVWSENSPRLLCPKFVIDIDRRCVGVFQIPGKSSSTATVLLQLDMRSDRAISIALACKQGGNSRHRRIFLEDQLLQELQAADLVPTGTVHPHDSFSSVPMQASSTAGRTMEGFRGWLRQSILAELDL